jgi:hypothetical protein
MSQYLSLQEQQQQQPQQSPSDEESPAIIGAVPVVQDDGHPLLSSSSATAVSPSKHQKNRNVHDDDDYNDVISPSSAAGTIADQSFTDESLGDDNDMESLLPQSKQQQQLSSSNNGSPTIREQQQQQQQESTNFSIGTTAALRRDGLTPLEIHMRDHGFDPNDNDDETRTPTPRYLFGYIRPYKIGNMTILFPQYFHATSNGGGGWGVLGPHPFGPVCVWLILVVSSHLCIASIYHHQLGYGSVLICYMFMALSTYRLTDVSLRDPGICLDKENPSIEQNSSSTTTTMAMTPNNNSNRRSGRGRGRGGTAGNSNSNTNDTPPQEYRFCDRCQVWQPPDGIHCVESDVCVSGYDHYCVWMGTCIGRNNYRQFVLFNMSWLYYLGYAFVWILTFGPMIMK